MGSPTSIIVTKSSAFHIGLFGKVSNDSIPASFSNKSSVSDNAAIADGDWDPNENNVLRYSGISQGSTVIHYSADATFTNSNGLQVTETKTFDLSVQAIEVYEETELRPIDL